jgi:hypothetical protein
MFLGGDLERGRIRTAFAEIHAFALSSGEVEPGVALQFS